MTPPLSPSHLLIPVGGDSTRASSVATSTSSSSDKKKDNGLLRLWLPTKGSRSKLDEYLARIPRVVSRANELLQDDASSSSSSSSSCSVTTEATVTAVTADGEETVTRLPDRLRSADHHRCLNVLQGEIAHVSADKADIVVSAEATTCHVVALRSTTDAPTDRGRAAPAFVSLAHIDRAYDACLENMVQEHLAYHDEFYHTRRGQGEVDPTVGFFVDDDELLVNPPLSKTPTRRKHSYIPELVMNDEVTKAPLREVSLDTVLPTPTPTPPTLPIRIDMELHIVGGYLDEEGLSQQLSTEIIERFDDLAHKYGDRIQISLSTAAISTLNNDQVSHNRNKPRSRGLGIDTRTGQVFAVKASLPTRLQGPALEIRSARVFSTQSMPSLSVIHDRTCHPGEIRIHPFEYRQRNDLNALLNVPDDVLLRVASTSPEHESRDFCHNFRRMLSFVNTVPSQAIFASGDKPLRYTRSSSDLNRWEVQNDDEVSSDISDNAIMF